MRFAIGCLLAIALAVSGVRSCVGGKRASEDSSGAAATATSTASSAAKTTGTTASKEQSAPKQDLEVLYSLIVQAETMNPALYSEASWLLVCEADAYAHSVIDGGATPTKADVTRASTGLRTAFAQLEKVFDPNNYAWPAYDDVARYPDSWFGQLVAFSGKVIQVQQDAGGDVVLRIAVSGDYGCVVMAAVEGELLGGVRVLEDDWVNVYGTSAGIYTYTSVLGAAISVPSVYADQLLFA